MKEANVYISAAVFLALTAVRILSPSASDRIADGMQRVLKMEHEQTVSVIQLGQGIAEGKLKEAFSAEKKTAQPTPQPEYIAPSAEPEPSPEPTLHPAVSAFLESQEVYSDYSLPDDVSYERPELPFEYVSPVDGVESSGFGYRLHPIKNEVKYHYGTDLAAYTGTPVYAFADGVVVAQGESDSYGKYVMIDHEDGYRTLYAHCSQLCMSCGPVSRGDTVALVGETGAATGPHLHFELECNGVYLNPEFYI